MILGQILLLFTFLINQESGVVTYPFEKPEIYTVDACPNNRTEWESASRRLNCSIHSTDFKNRYHCVATRDLTQLVEFCYPHTRSIFGKDLCVIFEPPSTLDSYTCLHFTKGCPDAHYFTDQLYQYPNCIRIEPTMKCFSVDELCLKRKGTTMGNKNGSSSQTFTEQNATIQAQEKKNSIPILVPTFTVLGSLFGIVVFAMILFKKNQFPRFFNRRHQDNEFPHEHQVKSKREDKDISVEQCEKGEERKENPGNNERKIAFFLGEY
ncbi:uncharacterized protein LOC134234292 [Saccostrea cucullata]|uniref:uncharacterized protein LOC134234292 n=1 Tax=Saccostrea cuccullata TaxID=36930 RepID=UPI002ED5D859